MAVFDNNQFRPGEHLTIKVGNGGDNIRLDSYLCSRFGQLSRVKMQRIIRGQKILVNGQKAKPSRKIHFDDIIELDLPSKELTVDELPLEIIYEDNDIIALNKQPGIIVHPARGNPGSTLLNGLLHYAENSGQNSTFVPGVIHRLDKETSGTIVFSKNDMANQLVSEQFSQRSTQKEYLAIVHGVPLKQQGVIEDKIGPDPKFTGRQAVVNDGKYAYTEYEVIQVLKEYCLLKVKIKTGRTHQIRVHLANINHPIVADVLYGGETIDLAGSLNSTNPQKTFDRVALHSWKLRFKHPADNKEIELESPLPTDMANFVNHFKNPQI